MRRTTKESDRTTWEAAIHIRTPCSFIEGVPYLAEPREGNGREGRGGVGEERQDEEVHCSWSSALGVGRHGVRRRRAREGLLSPILLHPAMNLFMYVRTHARTHARFIQSCMYLCMHARTHAERHADGGEEEVAGRAALEGVAIEEGEEDEHDHALAQADEAFVVPAVREGRG